MLFIPTLRPHPTRLRRRSAASAAAAAPATPKVWVSLARLAIVYCLLTFPCKLASTCSSHVAIEHVSRRVAYSTWSSSQQVSVYAAFSRRILTAPKGQKKQNRRQMCRGPRRCPSLNAATQARGGWEGMSLERGAARSAAALGAPPTLSYLWLVSNAFLDFPRVLPNAKFLQIDAKRAEVRAPSLH